MRIGRFEVRAVETGSFRLDGGAMFGVVPKVLWNKTNPADENNRIAMAMRAMAVFFEDRILIVDAGAENDYSEKIIRNYAIDTKGLRAALKRCGIDPDSVTDAVATHLHFDHAGGYSYRHGDKIRLALPNAVHHIQEAQWKAARNPNEKDRASFFWEFLAPIEQAGLLHLVSGCTEIAEGVSLIPTEGHTPGHQVVLISSGEEKLLYCGDLIPLASHVNLPYIMAYDHEPLKTLNEKKHFLGRAADERWVLFFEHDPEIAAARVRRTDNDGFELQEIVPID